MLQLIWIPGWIQLQPRPQPRGITRLIVVLVVAGRCLIPVVGSQLITALLPRLLQRWRTRATRTPVPTVVACRRLHRVPHVEHCALGTCRTWFPVAYRASERGCTRDAVRFALPALTRITRPLLYTVYCCWIHTAALRLLAVAYILPRATRLAAFGRFVVGLLLVLRHGSLPYPRTQPNITDAMPVNTA